MPQGWIVIRQHFLIMKNVMMAIRSMEMGVQRVARKSPVLVLSLDLRMLHSDAGPAEMAQSMPMDWIILPAMRMMKNVNRMLR
jgi:hypothetical protein